MKKHKSKRCLPHFTKFGKYVRYRIRNPKLFKDSSFRTHDIGRKGHSKRIAGRTKKKNKWLTQSILILKSDHEKGMRVKKDKRGYPRIFTKKTKISKRKKK